MASGCLAKSHDTFREPSVYAMTVPPCTASALVLDSGAGADRNLGLNADSDCDYVNIRAGRSDLQVRRGGASHSPLSLQANKPFTACQPAGAIRSTHLRGIHARPANPYPRKVACSGATGDR